MTICYKDKPVTEKRHLSQREVYGTIGYWMRLARLSFEQQNPLPIEEVVITPQRNLVEIIQADGPTFVRNNGINENPLCRRLNIVYS